MTDWRWIMTHQPRKIWNRVLDQFEDFNSVTKKHEDGLVLYYFRHYGFPSPEEFNKMGWETFDVALSLKGNIAVDVGSHVGSFALRLARNFRQVIAFEPNPLAYSVLVKNVKANFVTNVKAEQMAVSDSYGMTAMQIPMKMLPGSTIAPKHYDWLNFTKKTLVRADSLDHYFTKYLSDNLG